MRAAVNLHEQRIFLGAIEPGRLDDPALHLRTAGRGVPDRLFGAEFDALQHVGIHVREAADRLRAAEIESDDVGGIIGVGADAHRVEVARHRRKR